MGNCCANANTDISDNILYQNLVEIKIKQMDMRGKVISPDVINVTLNHPSMQSNGKFTLEKMTLEVSACVLPGIDPRGLINKECQDDVFYIQKENTLLVGLFDGHGKEGKKISNYCCKFMKEFFEAKHNDFVSDPQIAIENIIVECDSSLRSNSSGIDASLSGTTALVMYANSESFHVGSVGDSRGILSTLPPPGADLERPAETKNPYARKINPVRDLKTVPLSVDQKPDHQIELNRIQASGGKVQQLTDDHGNKVGPHRVWQKNGLLPGLAMSRSIGDGIAKEIGVIAEPVYHSFPYIAFRDQFIVISSDGVWDVLENIEVINYVEKFRKKCMKNSTDKQYPATLNNSSISRLLAEEARYRWLGICEEEDVMIDDISVLVIELGSLEPPPAQLPNVDISRKTIELNTAVIPADDGLVKPGILRGDVVRGSFIPADDSNKKKRRQDPKRGSYANKETEKSEDEDEIKAGLNEIPLVSEEAKNPYS
jgi:serine/threonine protein phosphatase PrpC